MKRREKANAPEGNDLSKVAAKISTSVACFIIHAKG
jgi:hypothetical protein